MRVTVLALIVLTIIGILFTGGAKADQRGYVWTYEYLTVPRGEAELETYFTISNTDRSELKGNASTEHKIELEVGMTDRFDFAIYQVFSQPPGESLQYDGFQLRARYRFGEKTKYFVDPLLYLEYKGVSDFAEHEVEAKLILARDFGRCNVALNSILEFEFGDENETNPEYALGMNYRVNDLLRLGIESTGSSAGYYMGPVIAHGKGRFWVTLGSAFNIGTVDEGKPEFQTRLLLGMGL